MFCNQKKKESWKIFINSIFQKVISLKLKG